MTDMLDNLLTSAGSPWFLFWAVVALAWLWEDASVVSAALLAADDKLGVMSAALAAYIGISSGDLGLYYLGMLARRFRALRAWMLLKPGGRQLRKRFRERTFSNILLIRFVPGLRTVGFTLCGLWKVPLWRFLSAMGMAGLIWVVLVFSLVYQLGSSVWLQNSPWKWSLVLVAVAVLIFNNLRARRARALVS